MVFIFVSAFTIVVQIQFNISRSVVMRVGIIAVIPAHTRRFLRKTEVNDLQTIHHMHEDEYGIVFFYILKLGLSISTHCPRPVRSILFSSWHVVSGVPFLIARSKYFSLNRSLINCV